MKYLIIFCILCLPFFQFGQNLKNFEYLGEKYGDKEMYLGLNPTFTLVRNNDAPFPERHAQAAFSADLSFRKVNFKKGSLSWNWQNKLLGDVILLIDRAFTDPNVLFRDEQTSFSSGPIGWLDWTIALNNADGKTQFSLGMNHHDYFYSSTYTVDTISGSSWASLDPQGYFFATGPTLKINHLVNSALMVEIVSSYSFSYWKAVGLSYAHQPNSNYPLPHFGQIDLELQTKWGFFGGLNYNWIINRGHIPSNGKRLDILLGFRFMI